MSDLLDRLTITISKTSIGTATYVQIASPAAMPVNVVLIADEVVIEDHRGAPKGKNVREGRRR